VSVTQVVVHFDHDLAAVRRHVKHLGESIQCFESVTVSASLAASNGSRSSVERLNRSATN
jgi:hypothetical protein